MTSCPREVDYLKDTLNSLFSAGFKPHTMHDYEREGVKRTFKKALRYLLSVEPDADACAVFQDDCLVARGLRDWFEWPADPETIGVVSLYCSGPHHRDEPGWFQADLSGLSRGAVAYVMPPHSVRRFLKDDPGRESRTVLDHTMGDWCLKNDLTYWLHAPSLVQHVGAVSALCSPNSRNPHKFGLTPARVAKVWCKDVRELCVTA